MNKPDFLGKAWFVASMVIAIAITVAVFSLPFITIGFSIKKSFFISAAWLLISLSVSLLLGKLLKKEV